MNFAQKMTNERAQEVAASRGERKDATTGAKICRVCFWIYRGISRIILAILHINIDHFNYSDLLGIYPYFCKQLKILLYKVKFNLAFYSMISGRSDRNHSHLQSRRDRSRNGGE